MLTVIMVMFLKKIILHFQVVNLMKPIIATSSHVIGNKRVDKGEDFFVTGSLFTPSLTERSLSVLSQSLPGALYHYSFFPYYYFCILSFLLIPLLPFQTPREFWSY